MHGRSDETHEDVELGDLEDDAFLPGATPTKARSSTSSTLTRWIPSRLRGFLENVSKIKLAFVVLILFVLALWVAAYRNVDEQIKYTIPEESLALRAELAKSLNGTSIPDYVLEYDGLIPAHLIHDRTQPGKLWDPTLAAYYYTFEAQEKLFAPAVEGTPVNWLYFEGRWGDDQFPRGAEGQEEFHGYVKWLPGPKGPLDKHLDRGDVCPPKRECVVRD
ncbi:vacuolar protein sorting-associated protein 62 [Diplocarpon rosae]|nr:vacuolar protein sorting-associated protein 62 [Diplocarpon rosae]